MVGFWRLSEREMLLGIESGKLRSRVPAFDLLAVAFAVLAPILQDVFHISVRLEFVGHWVTSDEDRLGFAEPRRARAGAGEYVDMLVGH